MHNTDNMHYSEKEHKLNKTYISNDPIGLMQSKEFKSNEDYEAELFKLKDETHTPSVEIIEYKIQYISPEINIRSKYSEEERIPREYGDTEFYHWLLQNINEKDISKSIAILAEIVNSPKLSPKIEKLRANVKNMKTITIDQYRKIKCIGTVKVEWLKQLKKKYGINVLRFLKMSIS